MAVAAERNATVMDLLLNKEDIMNRTNASVDPVFPRAAYPMYFDQGAPVIVTPGVPFDRRYRENTRLEAKLNHPADALRPGWSFQHTSHPVADEPRRLTTTRYTIVRDHYHDGDVFRSFQDRTYTNRNKYY